MAFSLPDLPYAYDALQPYMSAETLEFHHDKHHKAYLDAMTGMIAGTPLESAPIERIVTESFRTDAKLFNQAGQYYNHLHFWNWMKPGGGGAAPARLAQQIERDLGGMDAFRAAFIEAGKTQFGSGWCWLEWRDGKLAVSKTPNGENPLATGGFPILGCDVWEHSYYIDYRNARPKYLEAWFDSLINWEYADHMFDQAQA
jgi:Fe-Mn family superoxide dismutase